MEDSASMAFFLGGQSERGQSHKNKKYGLGQGLPASPWPGPKASRPVPGLAVPHKMSVRAQIIKNDANWMQNRRFSLKIDPEACQDRSGAFGMGLAHSKGPSWAQKVKSMPKNRLVNVRIMMQSVQDQTILLCQNTMLMSQKSQLPQYRNVQIPNSAKTT